MKHSREASNVAASPNHSVEPTGAGRLGRFHFMYRSRLAQATHAGC